MILSLGLILVIGFTAGLIFEKIKLPRILGLILIGILLGPSVLNWIDGSIHEMSGHLREIALVIILTRAGLALDIQSLKKVGKTAILLSVLPATFEIVGFVVLGPSLLGLTLFESILLGAVIGAVSPAIVVPRMVKLIDERYGEEKNIPELLLAGASIDDIYVIVLFYACLGLVKNNALDAASFIAIPTSIVTGVILGIITGFILHKIFKREKFSVTHKVIVMLGVSLLILALEKAIEDYVSMSALLAIMTMGVVLLKHNKQEAEEIDDAYGKLWYFFEIILFVLVGALVNLDAAVASGIKPVLIILGALVFRSLGVWVALLGTKLNEKEKLFSVIAYLPKATVQASIGGIALSEGLECGGIILTVAVLSIIITAPIGAILIDSTYKKLLK